MSSSSWRLSSDGGSGARKRLGSTLGSACVCSPSPVCASVCKVGRLLGEGPVHLRNSSSTMMYLVATFMAAIRLLGERNWDA